MVIRILEIPVRAHSPLRGIHSSDYVQAYLGFCHRSSLLECVCVCWGMFTPAALPSPPMGRWAFGEVLKCTVVWGSLCFFCEHPRVWRGWGARWVCEPSFILLPSCTPAWEQEHHDSAASRGAGAERDGVSSGMATIMRSASVKGSNLLLGHPSP